MLVGLHLQDFLQNLLLETMTVLFLQMQLQLVLLNLRQEFHFAM
jgi:hypothetical protein